MARALHDRLVRLALAVAVPVAVAACGGGFFISFGFDDDDHDHRLAVSLAVSPTSADPGQAVQLAAAASDPSGIDDVQFFRLDGDAAVPLGADGDAPFEWSTTVPPQAVGSVSFFARATDGFGHRTDSNVVAVTVGR